jgi:hypothetical protein
LTASEFAFLALGLVLGVASGAALIEVLRARPPTSRGIRVTVAPNAIQPRRPSTLADPQGVGDPVGPARGGPGDRRSQDEIVATGEPAATGRRMAGRGPSGVGGGYAGPSGTRVLAQRDESSRGAPVTATADPASAPVAAATATAIATRTADGRPSPLWLSPTSNESTADLVAVPMSMEPDPVTTALRASAALTALAAMTNDSSAQPVTSAGASPATASAQAVSAEGAEGVGSAGDATGDAGDAMGSATPPAADGPCAEERRVADERCAVATRAREGAVAAAETLRRAQRSYDEIVARAEAAAATADPRSVRTAKELAQQRFRDARTNAGSHEDVENGARAWLAEINQINHDTREASLGIERDRAAAAALGLTLERLAVEADAARISAERADEACVAAREAVAACDEARTLEAAAARSRPDTDDGAGSDASDEAAAAGAPGRAARIAAAMPEPEDEFAFSTPMNSQAGQDALIQRILRGDRDAMQRAVARLAGDDPEAQRLWQAQLGALMEALIARSIEASSFDFPTEHPFWGAFNQSQNRDIAAGLSSLGFRFDGFGNWVDERQPSQRDLSLAVGYAGLDPMRIRRWPNESETRELLQEVRVAADEYIAGAAGGLTLGELVTLLGRRADGLAELWNQWGSVRPILLEAN